MNRRYSFKKRINNKNKKKSLIKKVSFALLLSLIPIGVSAFILHHSNLLSDIFENKNKKIVKTLKDIKNYNEYGEKKTKPDNYYNKEVIYFCQILSDKVKLTPIKINIKYNTNKIEKFMDTLINPPNNLDASYTSLIPKGTDLLNYKLKDGLLILNFNDKFLRLSYGEIGNKFKVSQVVSTMTSIKEVDRVTFRINGEKIKYLDYDGIILNKSFTKNDIHYQLPLN